MKEFELNEQIEFKRGVLFYLEEPRTSSKSLYLLSEEELARRLEYLYYTQPQEELNKAYQYSWKRIDILNRLKPQRIKDFNEVFE